MTQRDAAFAGYAPYEDGEHPPYEFPRYASSTRRAPNGRCSRRRAPCRS